MNRSVSIGLLLLRLGPGFFMVWTHGLPKVTTFGENATSFPDPIGLGPTLSYILISFAEFACAGLVLVGLFTRFAAIPAAIGMFVAGAIVHGADPIGKKELAFLYFFIYATLACTGAGRFSIDHGLKQRWPNRLSFL